MSKQFIQKNMKLSLELDRYLSKNPRAFSRIPRGAHVVITVKGNPSFNKESRAVSAKVSSSSSGRFVEARKEGARWAFEPLKG